MEFVNLIWLRHRPWHAHVAKRGMAEVSANPPRTAAVSPGRMKPTHEHVLGDDDKAVHEPFLLHRVGHPKTHRRFKPPSILRARRC